MECNEHKNQLTISREREMICKNVAIHVKSRKPIDFRRSDRNVKSSKSQLLGIQNSGSTSLIKNSHTNKEARMPPNYEFT